MSAMRLFLVATIAVTIALTAVLLSQGDMTDVWWWLLAIPSWFWVVGPSWAPYAMARALGSSAITWSMSLFLAASSLFAGWCYYSVFVPNVSSTGSLIFLFMPVFQWLGFITAAAMASTLNSLASSEAA